MNKNECQRTCVHIEQQHNIYMDYNRKFILDNNQRIWIIVLDSVVFGK